MSVQLEVPLISLSGIRRPLFPSDPPTNQDILKAVFFLEDVKKFYQPPPFMRRVRGDVRQATFHDIAKAQLYLHKVCSAATAGTGEKVEPQAILDPEPIHTRLDRMNETLVRMMDDSRIHDSRIHRLEQQLDSDSAGQGFQHMEQTLEPEASEHRQRFRHPAIENTHLLYDRNHFFNDLLLYEPIPIWWKNADRKPEIFGLPPLRTNNDFNNLTDNDLTKCLYYYKVDIDYRSTRETKIHCLRSFIIGCSRIVYIKQK
ncbi:hypothetical protein DFJ58DRAFT_865057 [Suillus subalutaceus]|uniref:uncharacterized protein n=1 Tax=Suillus subalutaceus TaxID=48586 RepID=UPI001B874637|nr:uncharacterized protein DFJ58DRAFT_865057 [Suillus subalutaceus]KAG1836393.1 hypothetical protein DFJ58DRAFT_865057 [Suillus subalutaceus]